MQFYRFIQVETGIRERREKKMRKRKGSARNFGEEKEKKERGEKRLRGRRKNTRITKQQLRWGGFRPEGGRFLHLDAL